MYFEDLMRATVITLLAVVPSLSAAALQRRSPAAWSTFVKNGVFYPDKNYTSWRTLYARTVQLADESILLTWEDYDDTVNKPYFPIYKSIDGGATFQNFSRVHDQVNGWGLAYQPFLYTLPTDFGGFPAGTLLVSGASVPHNLSKAYVDLYASTDSGFTWSFVSHIVYGPGQEIASNGNAAVWEPFLLMYQGQLACFYSTQVDPKHGQKLSHKTTSDLRAWSAEVNDVARPKYSDRPGMTTVAYSPNTDTYAMTFEYCGGPGGGCPVYYKTSKSPLAFGTQPINRLAANGVNPNGSPYLIWHNGLFIANGNSRDELFINTDALDPKGWKMVDVGQWSAYSRSLRPIMHDGNERLLISNGGNIGCSDSCYNYVADAVVEFPTY